jgi:hypothetical protein
MITSKHETHGKSARNAIRSPAAAEPKMRRRVARSRRRKIGAVQDAMLHNWLLEKDDCSLDCR